MVAKVSPLAIPKFLIPLNRSPDAVRLRVSASRAVKEYLATLDDTAWGAATAKRD